MLVLSLLPCSFLFPSSFCLLPVLRILYVAWRGAKTGVMILALKLQRPAENNPLFELGQTIFKDANGTISPMILSSDGRQLWFSRTQQSPQDNFVETVLTDGGIKKIVFQMSRDSTADWIANNIIVGLAVHQETVFFLIKAQKQKTKMFKMTRTSGWIATEVRIDEKGFGSPTNMRLVSPSHQPACSKYSTRNNAVLS